MHMADIEWNPLPTPMWPLGSVMASLPGLMLKVSSEAGVPTWKVRRDKGKNAPPELVAKGTADSFEAAKAAALHMAETEVRASPSRHRFRGDIAARCGPISASVG
jgi:hypothetical protein